MVYLESFSLSLVPPALKRPQTRHSSYQNFDFGLIFGPICHPEQGCRIGSKKGQKYKNGQKWVEFHIFLNGLTRASYLNILYTYSQSSTQRCVVLYVVCCVSSSSQVVLTVYEQFSVTLLFWNVLVVLKRTGCFELFGIQGLQRQCSAVYLDVVYLVTALVPSLTACLASSPGSRSLTAVWISRDVMVLLLL